MSDISSMVRRHLSTTEEKTTKNVMNSLRTKSDKLKRNAKRSFQNKNLNVDNDALEDQNSFMPQPEVEDVSVQQQHKYNENDDKYNESNDESDTYEESNRTIQHETGNMYTDDENDNVSKDQLDSLIPDVLRQSPKILKKKYNTFQQSPQRQFHDGFIPHSATPITDLKNQKNELNKTTSSSKFHKAVMKRIRDSKYVFLIGIIAILALIGFDIKSKMNVNTPKFCNYTISRSIEPIQSVDVWETLSSGMNNLINNYDEPKDFTNLLVSLFTYKSGSDAPALVKKIANESNECFGNSMNLVEMTSEDFITANDYGIAIEIFKKRIQEGNVMLIAHLNEIPAEAARALHFICDTYNPVVKNVVIFLTLETTTIVDENPKKNAIEYLNDLWSSLAENELDPLITRVTDQVIHLKG